MNEYPIDFTLYDFYAAATRREMNEAVADEYEQDCDQDDADADYWSDEDGR
jgi:hypothetical protein